MAKKGFVIHRTVILEYDRNDLDAEALEQPADVAVAPFVEHDLQPRVARAGPQQRRTPRGEVLARVRDIGMRLHGAADQRFPPGKIRPERAAAVTAPAAYAALSGAVSADRAV